MKTNEMLDLAKEVRAIYQRDLDSMISRDDATAERWNLIEQQKANLRAIDRLLQNDFFEYLAGQINKAARYIPFRAV